MYKSHVERLRIDKVATDVILLCDGGKCEAHKIVLSACSPVFENRILQNVCPIIDIDWIPLNHVEKILDFLYKGNMNVSISELPTLLETVDCLQVNAMAVALRSLKEENPEQKGNEEGTK